MQDLRQARQTAGTGTALELLLPALPVMTIERDYLLQQLEPYDFIS